MPVCKSQVIITKRRYANAWVASSPAANPARCVAWHSGACSHRCCGAALVCALLKPAPAVFCQRGSANSSGAFMSINPTQIAWIWSCATSRSQGIAIEILCAAPIVFGLVARIWQLVAPFRSSQIAAAAAAATLGNLKPATHIVSNGAQRVSEGGNTIRMIAEDYHRRTPRDAMLRMNATTRVVIKTRWT